MSQERKLRKRVADTLTANGIGPTAPSGMHGWRCEHPDRYGHCDCFEALLDDLMSAIEAHP